MRHHFNPRRPARYHKSLSESSGDRTDLEERVWPVAREDTGVVVEKRGDFHLIRPIKGLVPLVDKIHVGEDVRVSPA